MGATTAPGIEALEQAIAAVRKIHFPVDALMYPRQIVVKVCGGCGTDDGDWKRWPCQTIQALPEEESAS